MAQPSPSAAFSARKKYTIVNDVVRQLLLAAGDDWPDMAKKQSVPRDTARKIVQKGRPSRVRTREGRCPLRALTEDQEAFVVQELPKHPSRTLAEWCQWVERSFTGATISVAGMHRLFKRHDISFKVNKQIHIKANTTGNIAKRKDSTEQIVRHIRARKYIIYMDESSCDASDQRSRGRAKVGLAPKVPKTSRGPRVNMIGAISTDGVVYMEYEPQSVTGLRMGTWADGLISSLVDRGKKLQNVVVICDNAPIHCQMVRTLEEKQIAVLRLAPYSPPLNPIEAVWNDIKTHVRGQLADKANWMTKKKSGETLKESRTRRLTKCCKRAVETISRDKCRAHIRKSHSLHEGCLALQPLAFNS